MAILNAIFGGLIGDAGMGLFYAFLALVLVMGFVMWRTPSTVAGNGFFMLYASMDVWG